MTRAVETFTLAELMEREFPEPRWAVPELIPEGLVLLCGRPKTGKSWLSLAIAMAVASGGKVLGRPCEQGTVLYAALEDNPRRLQRRAERLLVAAEGGSQNLHFATAMPALDAGGLTWLTDWLDAHPGTRLVLIDTFAGIRPQTGRSETVYTSDHRALAGLQRLAGERGIAIVVVHHVRKASADGGDVFDTVSGSTGLTGAADATLVLTHQRDATTLYGRGRDLEEVELAVRFNGDTCLWEDLGSAYEARMSDTRREIFTAMRDGATTVSEIARKVSDASYDAVQKALRRMQAAGEVESPKRGYYRRPLSECPIGPKKANDPNGRRSGSMSDPSASVSGSCPKENGLRPRFGQEPGTSDISETVAPLFSQHNSTPSGHSDVFHSEAH